MSLARFAENLFRRPLRHPQPDSLPCGGGLGRGHSPNFGNPSQIPWSPKIQALRLVALSLALSHGREDGVAAGIKGSARKIGCADDFYAF